MALIFFHKLWFEMVNSYSLLPIIRTGPRERRTPLPQIMTCIPPVGRYYGTCVPGAIDTVALGHPPRWSWIHPAQVSDFWDFNHCSCRRFRPLDCQPIRDVNDVVGIKSTVRRSTFESHCDWSERRCSFHKPPLLRLATHDEYLNEEASIQIALDERPSHFWLFIEHHTVIARCSVVWYGATNNLYVRIFTSLSILADPDGAGVEMHQDIQLQLSSEHDVFPTMSA